MGEGACVLRKLERAQRRNVLYPFNGARPHVGRKFLIAVDGQSFFQRQIEPVAQSNAIARPVVKILVRDDAFDVGVIRIRRFGGVGKHIFVVEDV